MKVAKLLEARQANWSELELYCRQLEGRRRSLGGSGIARFAALYRAACADLALADGYQLPPTTIEYLHNLVGRAHNQMYRSRTFQWGGWGREIFQALPRRLFRDRALRLAFVVFWGLFLACGAWAYTSPRFAEQVLGKEMLLDLVKMYSDPIDGRSADTNSRMAGFYVWNNPSIGLQCFAAGLLCGVGGLFITISNAAILGSVFGYMATVDQRTNFFHFVTAHSPFELTGVVLAAAAGMQLGFALVDTGGRTRSASLRHAAREAIPAVCVSIVLFLLAAVIEGFISPSGLPYAVKALVSLVSLALLVFYFVVFWEVLGGPPMQLDKTRIAIRERPYLDILDLALHVIRAHAESLAMVWLAGVLPLALLNFWLLSWLLGPVALRDEFSGAYLWNLAVLVVWEIPLATAPISLYLGQALFLDKPSGREVARQFVARLPQLIALQVILRGILAVPVVFGSVMGLPEWLPVVISFGMVAAWFFAYVFRPYLNEILLLERNPLRKRKKDDISTLSRARTMHGYASGDLLARWIMALGCGLVMTVALWLAMLSVRSMLTASFEFDRISWLLFLPAAGWIVIGYLTVVRFLSYLDLRIRSEGWEVELLLRAEGARLERQLA